MKRNLGFTLVELLIVVSLLAITLAIAAPSFGSLVRGNRVAVASDELQKVLTYARSEAITRGVNVVVSAPGVDAWTGALTVATAASTVLGAAETLRAFNATQLAADGVNSSGDVATLVFRPNGTVANAVTIRLCATNDSTTRGRQLTIAQGGQIDSADYAVAKAGSRGCS